MNKTKIGIFCTVIWMIFGFLLIGFKIDSLKLMPLNEIGDFLAGFFSPLAFLWLVLGYLQQGEELKLNTKALELQVQELRLSVEQQKELVEVTRVDVALSKQAHEREKEREIRQAQPIFEIQIGSYRSGSQGIHELEAKLFNKGSSATAVQLRVETGAVHPEEFPVIESGGHKNLVFDFANSPVSEIAARIKFFDGLGELRHQEVKAIKDRSGMFTFLPAKEVILTDC